MTKLRFRPGATFTFSAESRPPCRTAASIHRAYPRPFQVRAQGERDSEEMVNVAPGRNLNSVIAPKDIACQVELPLVSSDPVQLDQRQLNLWMPRENRFLVPSGAEVGNQKIIDEPNARIQQLAVTGGAIACH